MIKKKDDYQDLFQKKKSLSLNFLIRSYLKKRKTSELIQFKSTRRVIFVLIHR